MKKLLNILILLAVSFSIKANNAEQVFKEHLKQAKTNAKKNLLDSAFFHLDQAKKLFEQIKEPLLKADFYYNQANINLLDYNFSKAIGSFQQEISIRIKNNDLKNLSRSYNDMGVTFLRMSSYEESINTHLKALNIRINLDDTMGIADSYFNIASIYDDQDKLKKATLSYEKALEHFKLLNDLYSVGMTQMSIGCVLIKENKNLKGLSKLFEALDIFENLKEDELKIYTLINIAEANFNLGQLDLCFDYLLKAEAANQSYDFLKPKAHIELIKAQLFKEKEQSTQAIEQYKKALSHFESMNDYTEIISVYDNISDIEFGQKNYMQAYQTLKIKALIEDSCQKINNEEIISSIQEKYESEQKQHEIELKDEALSQQKALRYALLFAALLIFLALVFLIYNIRLSKQKNQLIQAQKKDLEHKKNNTHQSIQYAEKIQQSFLMSEQEVQQIISKSFVLSKPKDIIGGDFHWITKVGSKVIMAVIDCTGHGVPGALISMLANSSLNQIINNQQITSTDQILETLHGIITNDFTKNKTLNAKEGMDLFIASYDQKTKTLEYSGAKNKAYLVYNNQIHQLKATPRSIGSESKFNEHKIAFKRNEIKLDVPFTIYMFSDGIIDQFGGTSRKKFGSTRLKKLLLEQAEKPIKQQKINIELSIENWKKSYAQIDDIIICAFSF